MRMNGKMIAAMAAGVVAMAAGKNQALAQSCEPADIYPTRTTFGSTTSGQGIAAGDVNGDGLADMVVSNSAGFGQPATVSVFLGTAPGVFAPAVEYPAGTQGQLGVVLADFNNDGWLDIAVANPNGSGPGGVAVLLNDAAGGFGDPTIWQVTDQPEVVSAADIDGDGNMDLIVGGIFSGSGGPGHGVRLGRGDGTFAGATTLEATGFPRAIAVGDVVGDGRPDTVLATAGGLDVYLNDGGGAVTRTGPYAPGSDFSSVTIGDVNGDGVPDIIFTGTDPASGSAGRLLGHVLGDGVGGFGEPVLFDSIFTFAGHDMADIDGDGHLDAVTFSGNRQHFWLGDGAGGFTLGATTEGAGSRTAIILADLDQDGDPDMALPGGSVVDVRLNQCISFPPAIDRLRQPRSVVVDAGESAELTVGVTFGTPPVMFQWRRNGQPLSDGDGFSGTDTDTLTINPARSEQSDIYDVVVSNTSGSVTSNTALVAVRQPCAVDFDGDGSLTIFDFLAFQNAFDAGCP